MPSDLVKMALLISNQAESTLRVLSLRAVLSLAVAEDLYFSFVWSMFLSSGFPEL